jgi:hypothetical protein
MTEPLLLAVARLSTFEGTRALTAATGFFFARDERLFLVTSRHVFIDAPGHLPDRAEVELHPDAANVARTSTLSIPLYRHGRAAWRQAEDSGGAIDVAVIELDTTVVPRRDVHAFTPAHLTRADDPPALGAPLLIAGFPMGFHDLLHHLPVARHAIVSSAYGLRFQGQGYFLTDARTHRGMSGAPVVMRRADGPGDLPWTLLGVHSARIDMGGRDLVLDESLGLNCAWYADVLMTLTAPD